MCNISLKTPNVSLVSNYYMVRGRVRVISKPSEFNQREPELSVPKFIATSLIAAETFHLNNTKCQAVGGTGGKCRGSPQLEPSSGDDEKLLKSIQSIKLLEYFESGQKW